MTELEDIAADALGKVSDDGAGFGQFMDAIAKLVAMRDEHAEFVALTAPLLARYEGLGTPLDRWARWIDRGAHGDEDGMIRAVARRSQLQYAIDLYRGTPAEEALTGQCDEDLDDLLRERACELFIRPTPDIPTSHTWWCWPKHAGSPGQ